MDVALVEDIGNNTIIRHSRRRHNINSLLAKSPVVFEIADGDIPQQTKVVDLHHLGGMAWALVPDPPLVLSDVPTGSDPLPLSAPGVYLPE